MGATELGCAIDGVAFFSDPGCPYTAGSPPMSGPPENSASPTPNPLMRETAGRTLRPGPQPEGWTQETSVSTFPLQVLGPS